MNLLKRLGSLGNLDVLMPVFDFESTLGRQTGIKKSERVMALT